MIEEFYDLTGTVVRKTTNSPTGSNVVGTITTIPGALFAIEEISKLYVETNFGKEFDYVCDNATPARVGDDLYISGVKYTILGISEYKDRVDDSDSYTNIRLVK